MEEKIIKARLVEEAGGQAPATAAKLVKKEVYVAGVEAQTIVEAAEERAKAILAEAERGKASVLEAARREGREQGLAEWNEILASAEAARERLAASYEQELMRLSIRIAEKIIGEELRTRPETIVSIVRESLHSVRHERHLVIQVNPQEADEVRQRLDRLHEVVGPGRQFQVVADASVTRGGCMVETELGVIDARLETQLKCLEDALTRAARK
jgi:type III secretion protein L